MVHSVEDTDIMGNEQEQRMEIADNRTGEISTKSKRVRGLTRCLKLHKDYEDSKGVKHVIEFDKNGKFKGKYRAEISSFLGDLARKEVGLTELRWKDVSKDTKDLMWLKVTVCSTCLFIQRKYYLIVYLSTNYS